MNFAEEIVKILSKEELRNFTLLAERTNARSDRKDIRLLNALRSKGYDEDRALLNLYSSSDKNSFYRLKNRLVADLGKSLLMLNSEKSDFNVIVNRIILGRIFREKGSFKLARSYFQKAEKLSVSCSMPELLDLVYGELIRLSHESLEISPDEYIRKRKENRAGLAAIQEIDDVLAAVIYKIRSAQTFSSRNDSIIKVLEKTIRSYSSGSDLRKNLQLRTRVYQAVSRILLQRQDYISLEEYLLNTFSEFTREQLFNRSNHDTKLQMLVYLINSLFKNGKYELSLEYTSLLKKALSEYDRQFYGKYLFYYYSGLVINYTVLDKRKAIQVLEEAMADADIKKAPSNVQFLRLNLAVVNFDLKEYKASLKHLVKIFRDSYYENLDDAFKLKICIAEVIIRFEVGDADYILSKINTLKKDFRELLSSSEFMRDDLLLSFLKGMAKDHEKALAQHDLKKLYASFAKGTNNDVIKYAEWFKDRFMKKGNRR